MKLYEIDVAIEQLIAESVDEETGELLIDPEKLEALQLQRDVAVENLALYYKNLLAEAKAIKEEETALAARRKTTENAAERAKNYLEYALKGEKFKTPRVAISYRSSVKVEIADNFVEWAQVHAPDFLRYKDPEPDKTAIKDALKSGEYLEGASLVDTTSIQIK